jgi:HD-like signal output (HDOD) protein
MAQKRILIAIADPHALADYGRALEKDWTVKLAAGPEAALAEMAIQPCDVLVADSDLPGPNQGVELLDRIHADYPRTIRLLLTAETDMEHRITAITGSHLILTKPCPPSALKSAIERALTIDLWLANDRLRELVARLRNFPIVPSLYLEIINALKSPNTTTTEIGAIIAKDMAMMTKLLQVTNSACFGVPRKISDPVEAVGILGFETVKSMVVTLKLLSQYDKVKPVYFSIDRLWRHSTEVARISRRLALLQSDDPVLAESAFTAGLMHDLGKLVLASNFDEQYSGAQALARQQRLPLWDVEKQIFGASHAEIGAYLLGLWGMPLDLVEAAALHHNPSRCQAKHFNPLTAVHLANALFYESRPDKDGLVAPEIDEAHLAELGLSGKLQQWRQIVLEQNSPDTTFSTRSTETTIFKKPGAAHSKSAPRAAPSTPAPTAPRAARPAVFTIPQHQWVYAGMAIIVFLLAFLLGSQALMRLAVASAIHAQTEPAKPAAQSVPVAAIAQPAAASTPLPVASPGPPPETSAPIRNPQSEKAVVNERISESASGNSEPTVSLTPASPTAPANPKSAIRNPQIAISNSPAPPPPTAKDLAFAHLQLQSIIYSPNNPMAVISGTRVRPRDKLPAGATVVEIGPSSVTLEFENERKVLALK